MICQHCHSVLTQRNALGEPIIRNRGIVLKRTGVALVCPKCKSTVPFDPNLLGISPTLVSFPLSATARKRLDPGRS